MNSIHDMGGMDGLGPIVREKDEPVFHEGWERRVWGLTRAIAPWGLGRFGSFRYELERIPAVEYLRMSYYERWFTQLANRLLRGGLVTAMELETGKADPSRPKPILPVTPPTSTAAAGPSRQNVRVTPRFRPGQRVRSRNRHPPGHTRQPRYTRDRSGTVVRSNGVFALQDTDTDGQPLGGRPQHVYTVRFSARELWGSEASPHDSVYVDLWEDYLERA